MASKAATSQEVALLMDGPLTMGNFRCPVVVGSRFFQKTFNKDNVPGLGCKLLQKPLFSVEAHHRQAKRHCLVPGTAVALISAQERFQQ